MIEDGGPMTVCRGGRGGDNVWGLGDNVCGGGCQCVCVCGGGGG